MEKRRLSKHEIVDLIISKATKATGLDFIGDKRDGETPAITFQNFREEAIRLGAKALRTRLSRLSRAELLTEAKAALEYHEMRRERIRNRLARDRRERQAELGRRRGLQLEICEAARHYRASKMNAKRAWQLLEKKAYVTDRGENVLIKGDILCVQLRDGRQKRRGIKFAQWQKRYWVAAKRNSP